MKIEIIAVGNEVVSGYVVNSNASYIATSLRNIGMMTKYHSAICDEKDIIQDALRLALQRSDVILFTGGLGPTPDDLTKEAVCDLLNKPLEVNQKCLEELRDYFGKLGKLMPENNIKQVAFPKDSIILANPNGTAPGLIIEVDDKTVILLPGPPKELIPMVENHVIPYLKKQMAEHYITRDIKLFGISESLVAEKIACWLKEFEWGNVATYVGNYEIAVRITTHHEVMSEAIKKAEAVQETIAACLDEYVIGYNEDKLEEKIRDLLLEKAYTVATVESCTGGLLAASFVGCSGISNCFNEGMITYSNAAKVKHVNVSKTTLEAYGAVSEQTALEMAEGIKQIAGSTIGIGVTGIAGPGGGTPEKPVGLVYIGIAYLDKSYVYKLNLNGSRQVIREKTVKNVLYRFYQLLKQNTLDM